jgi:hypothetical protein
MRGLLTGGPLGAIAGGFQQPARNRQSEWLAVKNKADYERQLLDALPALNQAYAPYQNAAFSNATYGTPNMPADVALLGQASKDVGAGNAVSGYADYFNQVKAYNEARTIYEASKDYAGIAKLGPPPQAPQMQQGAAANADLLKEYINQTLNPSNTANATNIAKAPADILNTQASAYKSIEEAKVVPQEANARTTSANAAAVGANASMISANNAPDLVQAYQYARNNGASDLTFTDFMALQHPDPYNPIKLSPTGGRIVDAPPPVTGASVKTDAEGNPIVGVDKAATPTYADLGALFGNKTQPPSPWQQAVERDKANKAGQVKARQTVLKGADGRSYYIPE